MGWLWAKTNQFWKKAEAEHEAHVTQGDKGSLQIYYGALYCIWNKKQTVGGTQQVCGGKWTMDWVQI